MAANLRSAAGTTGAQPVVSLLERHDLHRGRNRLKDDCIFAFILESITFDIVFVLILILIYNYVVPYINLTIS